MRILRKRIEADCRLKILSPVKKMYRKLRDKKIEYRQTNQMVWQIRRTYQGGWKDFANELTSEETVRELIKKEYDVRY